MTEQDIIQRAQALVGKSRDLLTAEDKLTIGRALLIGKAENPADRDFGKWRKANGFGHLRRNDMADYQWLAENAHYDWFIEYANTNNVRDARLAWEAEQGKKLGRHDRMAQVLEPAPPEGMTLDEIQQAAPDLAPNARSRLTEMVQQGKAVRVSRGHYRLPNEQEKAQFAAENAKEQQAEEQSTGNVPGWSSLTRSGFLDALNKVRKWVRQTGQTAPFSRSADKAARTGTKVELFFPAESETYREAVESPNAKKDDLIDVSFTSIPDRSAGEEEETWEEPILGWVKGYRARVVVDPVWIPVDRKYQPRAEFYKPRKESPRKEGSNQ
jgi:hypothetical protein